MTQSGFHEWFLLRNILSNHPSSSPQMRSWSRPYKATRTSKPLLRNTFSPLTLPPSSRPNNLRAGRFVFMTYNQTEFNEGSCQIRTGPRAVSLF